MGEVHAGNKVAISTSAFVSGFANEIQVRAENIFYWARDIYPYPSVAILHGGKPFSFRSPLFFRSSAFKESFPKRFFFRSRLFHSHREFRTRLFLRQCVWNKSENMYIIHNTGMIYISRYEKWWFLNKKNCKYFIFYSIVFVKFWGRKFSQRILSFLANV